MLRPETQRLWQFLRAQNALSGFILIGGTALTLQLGHRLSEDLDLVWRAPRLPRAGLTVLIRQLRNAGFSVESADDVGALEEFVIAGMDLADYQQDFLVDGKVGLTFFTADEGVERLLREASGGGVRVASLAEIFDLKAVLCADRSKTRDWFDLYTLMRGHGFGMAEFQQAFEKAGLHAKFDLALMRLCSGRPQKDDEGFNALLEEPPTVEVMSAFFREQRDALEVAASKAVESEVQL